MLKIFKITENEAQQRLDRYLLKMFKNVSRFNIYKMVRTKDVKVNNKKADIKYMLQIGDEVRVFMPADMLQENKNLDFLKAKDDLEIIYEDNNILVIHKPVGLIVHDDIHEQDDTLAKRVKKYLAKTKQYNPFDQSSFTPSLCHRLDLNTSGLIMAAKNALALRNITDMFQKNDVVRKYYCLTYSPTPKNQDLVQNFMYKKPDDNLMVVQDFKTKDNKTALTKYKFIKNVRNYYLYEIELLTGRTHQIRAVMNYLNAPLVGETRYINKRIDKDERYTHQCLVSYYISFKNLEKYDSELHYLSNKEFKLQNIWFLR
ncbi:RluA family pseudouridine synthase [Ureaplasma miroungigenitalium]|uniref:RluA family pseudouridine synthase n=1 Tax=Ureaplasma miroungigenitalium TaxID=1042321 RepID=UPI0021E8D1DB|nr:RluA family pseudouridine synthase [Ureaplasma miroungigenitalium]MCV3734301.1 RluA family pseudouridine synthase [Ureaplasma miroungigenitalium]